MFSLMFLFCSKYVGTGSQAQTLSFPRRTSPGRPSRYDRDGLPTRDPNYLPPTTNATPPLIPDTLPSPFPWPHGWEFEAKRYKIPIIDNCLHNI